jgi:hypothetical protein
MHRVPGCDPTAPGSSGRKLHPVSLGAAASTIGTSSATASPTAAARSSSSTACRQIVAAVEELDPSTPPPWRLSFRAMSVPPADELDGDELDFDPDDAT